MSDSQTQRFQLHNACVSENRTICNQTDSSSMVIKTLQLRFKWQKKNSFNPCIITFIINYYYLNNVECSLLSPYSLPLLFSHLNLLFFPSNSKHMKIHSEYALPISTCVEIPLGIHLWQKLYSIIIKTDQLFRPAMMLWRLLKLCF